MVFDWFQRRSVQPQPAAETAAEVEAPPQETAPPEPTPNASDGEESQPSPPPAPPPQPAAAAPAGIDADALAWAREAYARLKAEQQAPQRVESAVAAPPAPPPAQEASPSDSPPAPPQAPQPPEPPAHEAPSQSFAAPPTLSLLERAAAERSQRQQELMEGAVSATTASPAELHALEPAQAPQESSPPGTPVRATAEEAEPTLGDFDEAFTWSAEVLAAQGRRADQVSLEEIDWLARLRRGMEKTRRGFVSQLLERLGDDPLTPEVLDDLESTLLRADVGVQATDQVLDALRDRLNQEVVDGSEGLRFLKEQLRDLLEEPIAASGRELLAPERDRLNIWLMVGVNGVGKTTTLG